MDFMEKTRIAPNITPKTPDASEFRASEGSAPSGETARTIVDVDRVDFHYHNSKALNGGLPAAENRRCCVA
jgi:hypothetical protein